MNKTQGRQATYFIQLDALRAIAVLLVIISHWFTSTHIFNRYTANGILGVTLFFVLSGFLITGILLRSKTKIANGVSKKKEFGIFYIRRALRIFPVYYLLIFLLLIFNIAAIRESFFWHFFYASNFYFWIGGTFHGHLSHFWSLSVEEQFYLFWPAVIFSVPWKYISITLVLGIFAGVLFRYFITKPVNDLGRILMPGSLDSFCIGGLLAYGRQFAAPWYQWYLRKRVFFLLLSGILLIIVHTAIFKRMDEKLFLSFYQLFISLALGIIIDRVADRIKAKPLYYILENRVLLYLGKISYGIYLYHNFIPYFYDINIPAPFSILSLYVVQFLRFCLLIAIASLSWFLFEKPLLGLKRKFEY